MNRARALLKRWLNRVEAFASAHPFWTIIIVLAIGAAILIIRRPETIFMAQFWAEDGRYWYAEAYNNGLSTMFHLYAGYFVVVYRVVAFASLAVPFHLAPAFMNMAALCFQVLPIVLLCSGRLRFITKRWIGIALALLLVCLPNSAEVFTNLTNIQWHLGVAAFLILLAQPAKSVWWRVFDYGVLIATGLSGPLVLILAPIGAWLWWRHKNNHHRNILIALVLLSLVQIVALVHGHRVGNPTDPNLFYFIQMIAGQIFTGGLLGQANVAITYHAPLLLFAVFAGGLALCAYAVAKGPEWLRLANLYSAMLIIAMLASLKPVPGFDPWQGLTNPGGGQRYWYIPMIVWISTLIWLAFKAPLRHIRGIALSCLGFLLLVGIPTDWRVTRWPYLNFRDHAVQFEHAKPGETFDIPLNPEWNMVLIKK